MSKTVRVMKLAYDGDWFAVDWYHRSQVFSMLEEAMLESAPCTYTVILEEMDGEEFDALPEFEGF